MKAFLVFLYSIATLLAIVLFSALEQLAANRQSPGGYRIFFLLAGFACVWGSIFFGLMTVRVAQGRD